MADEVGFARNLVNRVSNLGVFTVPANVYTFECLTDMDKRFCRRIEMDDEVNEIGDGFAIGAKYLRSVYLSDNLGKLPDNAFYDCIHLKNVKLPKDLKEIGNSALCGTKIKQLELSSDLESVGNGAFLNCKKLKHLTIDLNNENMYRIGTDAFAGCKKLRNFALPETIKEIGAGAFAGCRKIKKLNVPAECRTIEGNPFVSTSIMKSNGKMKVRDRWRAYFAKIEIDGMEKPIKARKFERMSTGFKGERLIWANGQVYCEREDGKFDIFSPETYAEKAKIQLEEIKNTQITAEAFGAFTQEKYGITLDTGRIQQENLNIFNTDKQFVKVALLKNQPVSININELREYTYIYEQNEINEPIRKEFEARRAELGAKKAQEKITAAEELKQKEQTKIDEKARKKEEAKEANKQRYANAAKIREENNLKKQQEKANKEAEKKLLKRKKELEKNENLSNHRKKAIIHALEGDIKREQELQNQRTQLRELAKVAQPQNNSVSVDVQTLENNDTWSTTSSADMEMGDLNYAFENKNIESQTQSQTQEKTSEGMTK